MEKTKQQKTKMNRDDSGVPTLLMQMAKSLLPIHASDQEALMAAEKELATLAKEEQMSVADFVRHADESREWNERFRTAIILSQRIYFLQKKLR